MLDWTSFVQTGRQPCARAWSFRLTSGLRRTQTPKPVEVILYYYFLSFTQPYAILNLDLRSSNVLSYHLVALHASQQFRLGSLAMCSVQQSVFVQVIAFLTASGPCCLILMNGKWENASAATCSKNRAITCLIQSKKRWKSLQHNASMCVWAL